MLIRINRNFINVFFALGILISCDRGDKKEIVQEMQIERSENITLENVELEELISAPKKWEGLYVEVEGYYKAGFEECALYVSQSNYGIERKAFWLNFEKALSNKMPTDSGYNGKKVKVRGQVSLGKGHLMQYAGTIEGIYYIALFKD